MKNAWVKLLAALAVGVGVLAALTLAGPADDAELLEENQVAPKRTKLTPAEAREYLRRALASALGRPPTAAELAMLMAQSAFETAAWQAMWWWNFGNSTQMKSRAGVQWYVLKDTPGYRYRAFDSADAGAAYFVNLIKTRFTKAWDVLSSGSPPLYASALKEQSYYTGDEQKYASGLAQHYDASQS
jgi:hypothetical protein